MAKQTKRERKFKSSGGVKARLDKGTITKKGKLKNRKKRSAPSSSASQQKSKKVNLQDQDRSDDFMGKQNLGDLDIDSFFSKVVENIEHEKEDSGDDKALNEEDKSSDSESSDSDDDDIEAAESRMKKEMAKMKNADPDFHEFLEQNEDQLLKFGTEDDSDDDDDDDDMAVASMESGAGDTGKQQQEGIQLTSKVLESLRQGTFQSHGIKSLKKLVGGAYRSACHLADVAAAEDEKSKVRPGECGSTYIIESSRIFDQLMILCLNRCHEEFHYHLLGGDTPDDEDEVADGKIDQESRDDKPLNPKTLEKSEKWAEMRPIILSFFRSTLQVMSQSKEPELITYVLKALSKYLRFLTPFPQVAQNMLKSLVSLWSAPLDSSEDYQVVRLNAFFRIRQLALTQPFPFIEDCLKKTYLAYAKRAKFATAASVTSILPTLTFMGNCLVELYSIDYHSSYQHAFVYIRQLALLLRSAMQKKTSEAFQQIHCWQYIHCLKLWVAVLAASMAPAVQEDDSSSSAASAMMRSLVFPLTEVVLGTARLVPSPTRHLPLRFHCVRLLQQLAAASEQFIPTTSLLLDCLDWKEWYLSPKKTKSRGGGGALARGLPMAYILRLPKEDTLRTHEQLEAGMSEWIVLMEREVELYRYSAGFPEFSVRIVQRLRRFAKECSRNARWRSFARACIETCERHSTAAVRLRAKLEEAPKDIQRLECLKQPNQPTMRERHDAAIQKEQKSLEGSAVKPTGGRGLANEKKTDDAQKQEIDREKMKSKKKAAGKIRGNGEGQNDMKDVPASDLEEEDEVQEGIDWSDDDE